MTSHVGRLYALAAAILVLFVAWAVVATHPWQTQSHSAAVDPRIHALAIRERRIRHESLQVKRIVARRWSHYRVELAKRKRQIAAAQKKHRDALAAAAAAPPSPSYSSGYSSSPSVQVVTLPPLTVTRTS